MLRPSPAGLRSSLSALPTLGRRPPALSSLLLRTFATRTAAAPFARPVRAALPRQQPLRPGSASRLRFGAAGLGVTRRAFHPTPARRDVFFLSVPALKSTLLQITRFGLLFLPFVFRYKLWKRYRRTSMLLLQIPVFAFFIVIALGLDQSPRTGRWRLLLMGENEEIAWSNRRHKEILMQEGPLLLDSEDARSRMAARVTERLVTALEEQEGHVVHGAAWPPRHTELARTLCERQELSRIPGLLGRYEPSGRAQSTYMPYRPQTQNPLKNLESADWNIYIIDLVNAFALPSKDIFIYTGLLNTLPEGDDNMLAAVLSHEIAHVVQRHAVENLGFLNVAAVAFDVLRGISFALTISFPFVTDSAGMFINWLNDVVAERAYSRKLEDEADAVGLELMATAGYDPRGMLDLWSLMACVEEDAIRNGQHNIQDQFALLRTHPTSVDREKRITEILPKAMNIWRKSRPRPRSVAPPPEPKPPAPVEAVPEPERI